MTETGDFDGPIEGAVPTGWSEPIAAAEATGPVEPVEPVEPAEPAGRSTGHPAVDEVLGSLEGLAERPVAEHVAVFEQAHEQLRRALSGQPGQPHDEP